MKELLYRNTEKVAYFLWEYTRHSNALDLWYCAEDICFFLCGRGIIATEDLRKIITLPKKDETYVEFVRHIAYRIHVFTQDQDALKNWFAAEKLLQNGEWFDAVIGIAGIYTQIRDGEIEIADSIRTERIRKLFWMFQDS